MVYVVLEAPTTDIDLCLLSYPRALQLWNQGV